MPVFTRFINNLQNFFSIFNSKFFNSHFFSTFLLIFLKFTLLYHLLVVNPIQDIGIKYFYENVYEASLLIPQNLAYGINELVSETKSQMGYTSLFFES